MAANALVRMRVRIHSHISSNVFASLSAFLVADTQLYERLCPSVGRSVGPLVSTSRKVEKRAYPPLPNRPQLMAVYPALFKISRILCVRIRIWIAFLPLVEWRVCD